MKPRLVILKREKRKDGTYQIKVAITHRHKIRYVGTGIYVTEFNPRNPPPEALTKLGEVAAQLKGNDLATIIRQVRSGTDYGDLISLLEARKRRFLTLGNKGYANLQDAAISKVKTLKMPTEIKAIDLMWLKDFRDRCRAAGLSDNTIGIRLQDIRAAWYESGCDGPNPWRHFKIPRVATRKRNLSTGQVQALKDMPLDGVREYARDMWLLSFYLLGIEFKDLCYLRQSDDRIEYIRFKTHRLISVKLFPEAIHIINRYKGRRHLLDLLERYKDHREAMRAVNRALKMTYPGLTTKWAKHTVASVMSGIGISHDVIARALGHHIDNPVTAVYINYDQRRTDEAHRRMIDAILPLKVSIPLPQFFN